MTNIGTKLSTGLGKGSDGASAAREDVRQAKENTGSECVDLSIVFSSGRYDHKEVVDAVREYTGNAPLIGASSAGGFTEEGTEKECVVVGLLSSDDIMVFTAMAEGLEQYPEATVGKGSRFFLELRKG